MRRPVASVLFSVLVLAGCEGGSTQPMPDGGAVACDPSAEDFAADALPRIERYCGSCHGETPDFGAPTSLLDHGALMAERADGTRLVDRIAARIVDGTMPPIGMPRMADADAQAIVDWASCGTMDVPEQTGLRSSAPPFLSPPTAPTGLEHIDFLATEYGVGPEVRDDYRCFVFDADIDGAQLVRRFEMVYDETRVLHHLVLLRDTERRTEPGDFDCYDGSGMPTGSQYLYAWAPGQSALEFPAGGLRIEPGERFIMQIHYNNGAGVPDVRDSSGVRLYLGPMEGPEYGMIAIGPTDFSIPARGRATVSSRCTFPVDTQLIAGVPHMHLLGSTFAEDVIREDGAVQPMIRLSGWDFDTQLFYAFPLTLRAGEAITTTCSFENPRDVAASSGPGTEDEMCFNFLYATPPPTSRYCDEGDAERPTDIAYSPGACVPAGTPTADLPLVRGRWTQVTEAPPLAQASVPDGRWVLESVDFYLTNPNTPIGSIDLDETYVLARGQLVTREGRLVYDLDNDVVVLTDGGLRFGGVDSYTFGGSFDQGASPANIGLDCPGSGSVELFWGIDGDLLTVGFESEDVPGSLLWPRYRFRRVP